MRSLFATQRIEIVASHQSGSISRPYNLHIFLVFIVRKSLDDISAEILARKYEPGTYIPVAKTFFKKDFTIIIPFLNIHEREI